jgi:hypothetical protein
MFWFFTPFFLELCICSDVISRWIWQRKSNDATFLSRVITGDGSWIRSYDPETTQQSSQWKSPKSPRPKRCKTGEEQSQEHAHHFDIKGILLTNNSSWQAKQSTLHTTVTFYGDCVKMGRRPCPKLLGTKNRPSHLFSPGNFFTKTNMAVIFNSSYFFLFPRLKIKLKGHHFDTIKLIKAESQGMLNTLIWHNFQDAFKKMAEALEAVHTCRMGLLRVWWWPVGPKLIFDQMAAPVPEIMDIIKNAMLKHCT